MKAVLKYFFDKCCDYIAAFFSKVVSGASSFAVSVYFIAVLSLFFSINLKAQHSKADNVFTVVEEQPEYPGGVGALMKYISSNVKYPAMCREMGIQGKVYVKFIVDETGYITNAEVIKSSGSKELDQEALRVVNTLGQWKPGKASGVPVKVYYNLPLNFKLTNGPGVEFNPNNTNEFYLEAKAFIEKGDRKAAKESLQKAIGDIDAWYLLGVLTYDNGDKKSAQHYFENVINNTTDKESRVYKNAQTYLTKYFGQQ